jgi:hypothetical protein
MMLFFVVMLMLSGITAFPVYTEMKWMMDHHIFSTDSAMGAWLYKVWMGVQDVSNNNKFLFSAMTGWRLPTS